MTQLPTTRTVRRARKAQRRGAMQRRVSVGATLVLVGLAGVLTIGFAGGPGAHGRSFTAVLFAIAVVVAVGGLGVLGWGLASSDEERQEPRAAGPTPAAATSDRRSASR